MPVKNFRRSVSLRTWLGIQLAFGAAFASSWLWLSAEKRHEVIAKMTHQPVRLDADLSKSICGDVGPLYDDREVISDDDLAAVLKKIVPRFSRSHLRPNLVEHALRTWGSKIVFNNADAISGPQMADFLTNTSKYIESWGQNNPPLMEETPEGIYVRWAEDSSASVHHDHTLAALTEAGLPLDAPVFTTARRLQVRDVLSEALRDFRLDERETEWSSMSFALWLGPQQTTVWHNGEGRRITFDMLAERLMRNHKRDGVCLGTHRVYTLMLMLRIDEQRGGNLMTTETKSAIMDYLQTTRDLIIASQSPDGSWPANWTDGAEAEAKADPKEPFHKRVIATGHHLEWLSIAPTELHPPQEQVLAAAKWLVQNTKETPQAEIDKNYTFYSHVGKALAMWRKTSPAEFWEKYRSEHPECEAFEPKEATSADKPAEPAAH
jgi:hypothetical protein